MNNNQLSVNSITFLDHFNKNVHIDKSGKSYYIRSFLISSEVIIDFICNLPYNQVCLINPFISINDKSFEPYLCLSKQFLVSKWSNPYLISSYLNNQFLIAENDFNFDLENKYYLIMRCKPIKIFY